ncbi:MAG: DUF2510 domain-containing protein [Propionibacteriaceae bacterium]|jgi:hypothetical protein|nr:DUF2510 domain-containing protein [Propionibacteriaceae bacterium]
MAVGLPGWYPDPGGSPGLFRYWDGHSWSELLSPTPYAPAPVTLTPGVGGTFGGSVATVQTQPMARRRSPAGPILITLVVVVVLGLVAWLVIPRLTGGSGGGGGSPEPSVAQPTGVVCPQPSDKLPETYDHPDDGWVHGGRLAFPEPGDVWGYSPENRVPFGRDVNNRDFILHYRYDGKYSWVASMLVAELYAGDGFFSPKEGAEIVTRCVLGEFYSDAVVTRNDSRNESYPVDGDDGWIIETNLSFSIPNLPTTSESVTIIVVATGELSSSLFFSSLPDDSPDDIKADVASAIENLKVSD